MHLPRPIIVAMGGALPTTQTQEVKERCFLEKKWGLFSKEGQTDQMDKCAQKPNRLPLVCVFCLMQSCGDLNTKRVCMPESPGQRSTRAPDRGQKSNDRSVHGREVKASSRRL